jgi:anti-sigma B factor antagonist
MTLQSADRHLELKDIGDVTVASFIDHYLLDAQKLQVIGDQLSSLVDDMGRKKLLLNFANVRDISSLALGMLVTLQKKVHAAGGKLVLYGVDPQIREVLALTRLDEVFVIRGDEQEALTAF